MKIERIEGAFSGGVFPIYRNRPRNVLKQETKKTYKPSGSEVFEVLFEKATSKLAKSLKNAGKGTYGKYGTAKDYDYIVGTLFDEKA